MKKCLKSKSNSVLVLADDSQLQCLKSRGNIPLSPVITKEIYGPESFADIKMSYFDLSDDLNGFEYDFSNCFYDRIIPDVNIAELDSALGLINLAKNERYYFYKSSKSETVTIYVKR